MSDQAIVANPPSELSPAARRRIDAAIGAALAGAAQVDIAWIQPPPSADGWTLAPDALRFLTALVPLLKPRHILEMGSGLSTRVLARAAAGLRPRCAISSIDHDPQFGPLAAMDFARQNTLGNSEISEARGAPLPASPKGEEERAAARNSCRVKFQVAPVVARDCGGKILPVYYFEPKRFASRRPPDLVVIDGPPVNLGGREGTLYQIMELARPGTLVLLDDADRAAERSAVAHWLETLGEAIEMLWLPPFTKGMAAILVRQRVPMADLWNRRAEMTRRDLEKIIPAGAKFILADLQMLEAQIAPGRGALPFLEMDGQYWGPPESDAAAIAELERQRRAGARYIALTWPVFWWFEYYVGFFERLRGSGRCILENDRVVIFELSG